MKNIHRAWAVCLGCTLAPVSYTHLDVYKRQERNFAAAIFDLADHDADLHALNGAREA